MADISAFVRSLESAFYSLPGSAVVVRYVKSSHQNDPGRTFLEIILIIFAIRTLLQSRTRADTHFIKFTDKEIDELVEEWSPEPLCRSLDEQEQKNLDSVPVIAGPNGPKPTLVSTGAPVINFASYNFTGLAGNEHIKDRAIQTLRKYGLGSCGPPGFYGTLDVHTQLENTIAAFLRPTPPGQPNPVSAILYSQSFSTISSVIPAFVKRGDIILADRQSSFAIRKGLQISRAQIRWYEHNDMNSLEELMLALEREDRRRRKRRGCLQRFRLASRPRMPAKYIVTEALFERNGQILDLPKLIELKYKYKYRLILDESLSFGTLGRYGRGITEYYNVPAEKIDMLVGSVATGLGAGGGFCAGSRTVVEHQRINSSAFVFSASLPALLAVSATEAITLLSSPSSPLVTLRQITFTARSILDQHVLDYIDIVSHPDSPVIHLCLKDKEKDPVVPRMMNGLSTPSLPSPSTNKPKPHPLTLSHSSHTSHILTSSLSPRSPLSSPPLLKSPSLSQPKPTPSALELASIQSQEQTLQHIVDLCLARGILVTRAKRLRGQEVNEPRPSIRIAICAGLEEKEVAWAMKAVCECVREVLDEK